jgi:hypothetical protein
MLTVQDLFNKNERDIAIFRKYLEVLRRVLLHIAQSTAMAAPHRGRTVGHRTHAEAKRPP